MVKLTKTKVVTKETIMLVTNTMTTKTIDQISMPDLLLSVMSAIVGRC